MIGPYRLAASLHRNSYRPDIDGLRALAVLAVVVSHAFPTLLPGGFVGVDVFFVISGCLITAIILRDLDQNAFSIRKFYERRIRRIFPALVIVLAAPLAIGWLILAPAEFRRLGRHVLTSSLFSENFQLWSESGYFDDASLKKPLLHLWSLAIEEQFYILWPAMLVLARRGRGWTAAVLALLGAASFAINLFDVRHDAAAAYYSPLGRFWELMVGASLAYVQARRPGLLTRFGSWRSALGGALLAAALAVTNPHRPFPGLWALAPTLGAVLLMSGGEEAWINRRLLAAPPLVWIGLISYPLYLWHWPLLSFCAITFGGVSAPKAALLVGLAISAAALTFFLAERPFRKATPGAGKSAALALAMAGAALCGALVLGGVLAPRLWRLDVPARNEWDFLRARTPRFEPSGLGIYQLHPERQRQVLFVGDSHLAQYAERLDRIMAAAPSHSGAVLAIGGACAPIDGVHSTAPGHDRCRALRDRAYGIARPPRFTGVVIGGNWNWYFLDPQFVIDTPGGALPLTTPDGRSAALARLERRIAGLVGAGERVTLVLDNPLSNDLNPAGMAMRLTRSMAVFAPNRTVRIDPRQRILQTDLAAVGRRAGARIVDPFTATCTADDCRVTGPTGQPLYKDTSHFNPDWAVGHADFIDVTLEP